MMLREIAELALRVAELERRQSNNFRHGTVEKVDAKKQLVRIKIGEPKGGEPFIGPWVPYAQIAGALKLHSPPSKGQQMTLLNPTGDFRQAVAIPMTWSDQNKSPSEKEDEHKLTFGDVKITLSKDKLLFEIGEAKLSIAKDEIFAEVGSKRVGVTEQIVYSVGKTRLGLQGEGEKGQQQPFVETDGGTSTRVEAKI